MSCPDDIKTLLSRLVDGELNDEERARVEGHTADCAACGELLGLFRRNENLLAGALQTDAFGDAVIESVVRSLRQEGPPEAAPVEDGPIEWLKARPLLASAAGLLIALGTMLAVLLPQASELRSLRDRTSSLQQDLEKTRKQADGTAESSRDLVRVTAAVQEDYERTFRELRARDAVRGPGQPTLGYHEDRGLAVRASFDGGGWERYELWRRGEDEQAFSRIGEGLRQPETIDRTAKPGRAYTYKFRALKSDGTSAESTPLQLRMPFSGDLSPESSVRIHCFDLAVTGDVGIFLLERLIDGRAVVEKFVVSVGEALGGRVDVPGTGLVDFSTGLVLHRIEEGHQTLPLTYAEPVLDDQGRPVVQRIENGRPVYLTRQHDVPLSIRPNLRAVLKAAGTAAETSLFKGSWTRARSK